MTEQNVAETVTTAPGFEVLAHASEIRKIMEQVEYGECELGKALDARGWGLYALRLVRAALEHLAPMSVAAGVYDAADQVVRPWVANPLACRNGDHVEAPLLLDKEDDRIAALWDFARHIHECREPANVDQDGDTPADLVLAIAVNASHAKHEVPEQVSRNMSANVLHLVHAIMDDAPGGHGLDRAQRFVRALEEGIQAARRDGAAASE